MQVFEWELSLPMHPALALCTVVYVRPNERLYCATTVNRAVIDSKYPQLQSYWGTDRSGLELYRHIG